MSLFPFYNLPSIKIEEEYTLMDAAAMITATGGSLSIFVGLSCYGFVWRIFEWLESSYRSQSGRRSSIGTGGGRGEKQIQDGGDDVNMWKARVTGLTVTALTE